MTRGSLSVEEPPAFVHVRPLADTDLQLDAELRDVFLGSMFAAAASSSWAEVEKGDVSASLIVERCRGDDGADYLRIRSPLIPDCYVNRWGVHRWLRHMANDDGVDAGLSY